MKKLLLATLMACLSIVSSVNGQLAAVKKFDYSILKDKILYIPTYEVSKKIIDRMAKRGRFDKIKDTKSAEIHYNKIWREAMAESSYDATKYEIKSFDQRKLIKSKDPKAILLYFILDEYGNKRASMMVTGPKKKVIANTIITGLDLSDKNDIRLMMNMLNESLNTAAEINEEGNKSTRKANVNKYKLSLIAWSKNMKDKTFLVPASEHKNAKKRVKRDEALKEALQYWHLTKYKFTTEAEINKKRVEGDKDSFYWKSFPIYTNSPLITYHYNVILSTDGDDVIMVFLGKKRLKPAALEQTQKKIKAKVEKYEKQMNKK